MIPPLHVMVPGGRDALKDYACALPSPFDACHPPVNFHAMAAATGARFITQLTDLPDDARHLLILIPRRWKRTIDALEGARARKCRTLLTWKECGHHQLQDAFAHSAYADSMRHLFSLCDAAAYASLPARKRLQEVAPSIPHLDLPTPYPVDIPEWNALRTHPPGQGIFLGTREWNIPARHHRDALHMALELAAEHPAARPVTCINTDGWRGRLRTRSEKHLRILPPLPYLDYLRTIAAHRLIFQRDASSVPGQVAGDALLAGVPCLGGSGRVDSLAFPHLPNAEDDTPSVLQSLRLLIDNDQAWEDAVRTSQAHAETTLSFHAFRQRWQELHSLMP